MQGVLCCFRTSTIHLNYNLGLTPKLVLKLWSQGKCRSDFIGQCSLLLSSPLVGFCLLSRYGLIFWHHESSNFCQVFFMVPSICYTEQLSSGINVYPSCFYVIQSLPFVMSLIITCNLCFHFSIGLLYLIIVMMFQFIPIYLVLFCFFLHVNLLNSHSCQCLLQ